LVMPPTSYSGRKPLVSMLRSILHSTGTWGWYTGMSAGSMAHISSIRVTPPSITAWWRSFSRVTARSWKLSIASGTLRSTLHGVKGTVDLR